MAEVALDRADHAAILRRARLAVGFTQRRGLDRIAHRRSGPVRLDELHALRRDIREPERIDDVRLLRGLVGQRDAGGAAVLVDRSRADDA